MAVAPTSLRPAWIALLLSVVAGLGHLVIARPRRGLLLFMGATLGWNLALLSILSPTPPLGMWTLRGGLALGVALTLFSVIDVFRMGVYARLEKVGKRHRETFEQAVTSYLKRDWHRARHQFESLLESDPADPVVRLYLATLERRAGRMSRARHHARKALASNPHHEFTPELEREIVLTRKDG